MQCACVILSSLTYLALPHFYALFHTRHDFRKKMLLIMKSVVIFSKTFICNIFHSKKNWARYDQQLYWYSCKVPVILVKFNAT
jgi:hypothetical protein